MATIALYKNSINRVGFQLESVINSSDKLSSQLNVLKNVLQGVDSSTCDLQDAVDSITSSTKSESDIVEDVRRLNAKLSEFINMAVERDDSARSEIVREKNEFYEKYSYLKPDCEKKKKKKTLVQKIQDSLKKVCDWCKEHSHELKIVITIGIVVTALAVVICCPGASAIVAGACWGAISGACIGGVAGGINSQIHDGEFWDGFVNGACDGAIGGAIGGAITGGILPALGPAATYARNVGQGAAVEAISSGMSNMAVTTIDYLIENGNLVGASDDIIWSGFAGALSGGILGGIAGGIKGIEKYGLKVENGKVDGKIPLKKYLKYRKMSIHNPDSDTMTLGKYRPSYNPDGTQNWLIPGPDSYTIKAGDTTYFDLGNKTWYEIKNQYGLDDYDMFRLFNIPALDDAVNAGKTIRFSHDPRLFRKCALEWEWNYLKEKHGFIDITQEGDLWYGESIK